MSYYSKTIISKVLKVPGEDLETLPAKQETTGALGRRSGLGFFIFFDVGDFGGPWGESCGYKNDIFSEVRFLTPFFPLIWRDRRQGSPEASESEEN